MIFKYIKQLFLVITFILFFINLNISRVEAAPSDLIYISPSQKVVTYEEEAQSIQESITITNGYDTTIVVEIAPLLLQIEKDSIKIVEDYPSLTDNVTLNSESSITINPKSSKDIGFVINNPQDFKDNLQIGISVTPRSARDSSDNIDIGQQVIATFVLENEAGNVGMDVKVEVNRKNIFTDEFMVTGEIMNSGERIITPSGSILIRKGDKRLTEVEITTDINKSLLPGQTITFERELSLKNDDLFELLGSYTIETTVTPNPFTSYTNEMKTIFIIPIEIFLVITSIILLSFLIISYSVYLYLQKKQLTR